MSETRECPTNALHSLVEVVSRPSPDDLPAPLSAPVPVSHSTLTVGAIRDLVLRHYDLGEPVDCVPFLRAVSNTYLLSTPVRRLALKVYPPNWRTHEAIVEELNALQHLREKGVNVAMPVCRRDGTYITDLNAPEGLRKAVAFRWANGRAPAYTDSIQAECYGRMVAKMHRAGDDIRLNGERPVMDMNYLLRSPLERICPRLNNHREWVSRLIALVERTSARLERAKPRLWDWGFCHGDLHAGNARIDRNRVVLFDFDHSGAGWRLIDLASYRLEARRAGVEQRAWIPFMQGYQEIRDSDPLEFTGLFMILRYLWTTANAIELSEAGIGVFFPSDDIDDLVPFCEAIEGELVDPQML